jgi:hypothetical protein
MSDMLYLTLNLQKRINECPIHFSLSSTLPTLTLPEIGQL